jgi:hypothetical protein
MDIQLRKIHFVQEFLRLENEQLIAKLEDILISEKKKLYESGLKPYTVEELYQSVQEAKADADAGRVTKAEDLQREIDSWT